MPRPKGSPNKITSEVRSKLQDLLDDLIDSLDLNELDANQRIKMLQIALQYTLPKLKQEVDEVKTCLCLLIKLQKVALCITFLNAIICIYEFYCPVTTIFIY